MGSTLSTGGVSVRGDGGGGDDGSIACIRAAGLSTRALRQPHGAVCPRGGSKLPPPAPRTALRVPPPHHLLILTVPPLSTTAISVGWYTLLLNGALGLFPKLPLRNPAVRRAGGWGRGQPHRTPQKRNKNKTDTVFFSSSASTPRSGHTPSPSPGLPCVTSLISNQSHNGALFSGLLEPDPSRGGGGKSVGSRQLADGVGQG